MELEFSGQNSYGDNVDPSPSKKVCGVCGDVAKSFHFGGLSCDSCKAFFRRSVQNDSYKNFLCCQQGRCSVTKATRKSCQSCRMKRCFLIGMEKSWVMTEAERKALMALRLDKRRKMQQIYQHRHIDDSASSGADDYQPRVEHILDFMEPPEMAAIEDIVTKYAHAYHHVPYNSHLKSCDEDRPGEQVMEMFATLIRRFCFYSRLMADFYVLPKCDQNLLISGGVLEMCYLRGALVFDPTTGRWPNVTMALYKDAPVLKLDNMSHMTSAPVFQKHMEFIGSVQQMGVDEPIVMLMILIILFTPERDGLLCRDAVAVVQERFSTLLLSYVKWQFGPSKGPALFGKLVAKLSDLRELSESHNHLTVHLRSEELAVIQESLSDLKINPYPQMRIFPDAGTVGADLSSNLQVLDPASITGHFAGSIAGSSSSDTSGEMSSKPYAYHIQQQQSPIQSLYPQNHLNINREQQQQWQQHESGERMETAMVRQFMNAIHQSISQIINTPHFGFEWVSPEFHFEDQQPVSQSLRTENVSSAAGLNHSPTTDLYAVIEEFVDLQTTNDVPFGP